MTASADLGRSSAQGLQVPVGEDHGRQDVAFGRCRIVLVDERPSPRHGADRCRTDSNAARALSSASGRVWRYFWVVMICAWPMRSMTDFRSAPPARSQEAWAWRRSWTRTWKSMPERCRAGNQTPVRIFRQPTVRGAELAHVAGTGTGTGRFSGC